MSARWKQVENALCRYLWKVDRRGPTGRDTPDCKQEGEHATVDADFVSPEIKHGEHAYLNQKLREGMRQAVENAEPFTVPVLVLHPTGYRIEDSWVCMPAEWFLHYRARLHGVGTEYGREQSELEMFG